MGQPGSGSKFSQMVSNLASNTLGAGMSQPENTEALRGDEDAPDGTENTDEQSMAANARLVNA
jgi:hypothetical protein